jgi:hypothetical protein
VAAIGDMEKIGDVYSVADTSAERLKAWVQAIHARAWHNDPGSPPALIIGPFNPVSEKDFEDLKLMQL